MSKFMLIDAAHAEETRVAVVDGHRVEEFDFESRSKKQLRGNIYLARVTRVEPSLQAAFIEYGGNRHGFLAFDQIHPDYYQIPVADREALMAEPDDEEDVRDAEDEDEDDEVPAEEAKLRRRMMRRYKIQEVIKRRQILLVQVVKEERGSKGAALTTYLSLAGRYCVLMPNTARGGGISRKITQATDRKRLKTIAQSLEVPNGMGVIIRTAGAKRTKQEITRDYDYLLRLWESIRETTLQSIAPALIYEEEDLVKRALRDMYDKDVDAVLVDGEAGWREARDFMRMIMPSHAKKVQLYQDPTPLFVKHRVEDALAAIHSPVVPLKSGGYLVINQTEALVAIDVNSGRSTKERNIEATALKTNCEAAEEAARQLRLRDLAGLIVIDFIDMDESKNNRTVEKKLKDALDQDRARIQMGKISSFGLMELSRQRRRSGVLEGTTHVCEHCQGTGRVRSTESSALQALRGIEMESARGAGKAILRVPTPVALYILNEKRAYLARLEQTSGLHVVVQIDDSLAHAEHAVERTESREYTPTEAAMAKVRYTTPVEEDLLDDVEEEDAEEEDEVEAVEGGEDSEGGFQRDEAGRRGRRRRRRGGRRDDSYAAEPAEDEDEGEEGEDRAPSDARGDDDSEEGQRRRRRGRRGGRRGREEGRDRDPYAWVRGRTPNLDEPYVWFDPIDLGGGRAERRPVEAAERSEAPERPDQPFEDRGEGRRERGGRRRRGRGRGRDRFEARERPEGREGREERAYEWREPTESEAEPYAAYAPSTPDAEPETGATTAVPETPVETGPVAGEHSIPAEPVKKRRVRSRKAADVVTEAAAPEAPAPVEPPAPAPVPEAVVVALEAVQPDPAPAEEDAEAAAPAEPDPHEITAPPEQPRRGWWRRKV